MSTAWYKPSVAPKLLSSFTKRNNKSSNINIEVWNTTCIVTNFGKTKESACTILVNPSNPGLSGVRKFPYFPRGGPVPNALPNKYEHHIMGYVSQWGGMNVQKGMLFPPNVIDGIVHDLGGWMLLWHCYMLPNRNKENLVSSIMNSLSPNQGSEMEKCPVGCAVSTPPGGWKLKHQYDEIVHTVPPFYNEYDDSSCELLAKCYRSALDLGFARALVLTSAALPNHDPCENQVSLRVACPLLGAGCRGFPLDVAVDVAAKESIRWLNARINHEEWQGKKIVLAFGIPVIATAEKLIDAIQSFEVNQY